MNTKVLLFWASLLFSTSLIQFAAQLAFAQSAVATDSSAPNNSARNVRDRYHQTLTPFDQSNKPADLTISRQIRKAVVQDDQLSTEAKNVKIITVDGAVTLRGPVKSEQEKAEIVAKAASIAGDANVHNQLEVAGN
jgi:hyperosmotically inducible protein